jgi:hypothetical protein
MGEREALAATARAAGLRLRAGELDDLLGSWKRYRELMEELAQFLGDQAGLE